jgi:crotonobetainyl-CoA:carnitine CoA-transferase CaiB-like acyl-CoA transferase
VTTVEDLVASKQLEARGFFTEIQHHEMGRTKCPTASYRFSETPWRVERAAPLLGEHNQKILVERLGYAKDDLIRMRAAGII